MNKMIHIYQKGTNDKTLLLLHGTGGDEYDLLKIGKIIDDQANILSVRGNVKYMNESLLSVFVLASLI